MENYGGFARVYDELMDDVPYEAWVQDIVDVLSSQGVEDGLVLDLGCGTGTVTEQLAARGYDMIGVDSSVEMLDVAREKCATRLAEADGIDEEKSVAQAEGGADRADISANQRATKTLYLCQDMRSFELYGTVRAIICVCDSINYITSTKELTEVFRLIDNYLDPGGLLYLDVNTVHKYRDVIGMRTIAESREDVAFIWENSYDEVSRINECALTLFIREEGERFHRTEELHCQRGYDAAEIDAAIRAAGLMPSGITDADTGGEVTTDTERMRVIARECRKYSTCEVGSSEIHNILRNYSEPTPRFATQI